VRFGRLKAELKGSSAEVKALASAALTSGRLVLTSLPPAIANRVTHANRDLAKAARGLLPVERGDVACGRRKLNGRPRPVDLLTIPVGDLADVIVRNKVLANKLMLAFDLATCPVPVAAE
jgi:hypothetical protein